MYVTLHWLNIEWHEGFKILRPSVGKNVFIIQWMATNLLLVLLHNNSMHLHHTHTLPHLCLLMPRIDTGKNVICHCKEYREYLHGSTGNNWTDTDFCVTWPDMEIVRNLCMKALMQALETRLVFTFDWYIYVLSNVTWPYIEICPRSSLSASRFL